MDFISYFFLLFVLSVTCGDDDSRIVTGLFFFPTFNADMTAEMKKSTLIHEWIHATLDLQGMGDLSNNEQLVSVLANELYRQGFRIKCIDDNGDCCL